MTSVCANLASNPQNIGYTTFGGRKEEGSFRQASSKMTLKRTKEETAEVRRGRLVRSTGTKDRHSKVCTAKGPRERRVRLSADTAIQFYDVQDRLGCDRPSKAIDWLMQAAKDAIDALDQLPATNPNAAYQTEQKLEDFKNQQQQMNDLYMATQTSYIDFNTHPHGLNSRTRSQTQDICLALQSFQTDPILPQHHLSPIESLFSASTHLDFNATWNSNSNSNSGNGKGSVQQVLNQNQLFSQREPLQSIFSPSIRMPPINYNPPPVTGIGFAKDGLPGFWVSPCVQGQDEEHNPFCIKSSSETTVLHYQD